MFLGIDLGTTYSAGAYIDDNGEAQIITNAESEHTTPSVVYFESAESVVVGQPAKDMSCIAPDNVISLVKNHMGAKNNDGSMYMCHTNAGDYLPEVVSGFILKKVVADANAALNLEEPIKDVVVTVPAYFTDAQRQATENAIEIAGLNRLALLNEPTAAALYYAQKCNLTDSNILIYDLGGGTFDVTIVHLRLDQVEVLSTGGLSKVGGSYFDRNLVQRITLDFKETQGIDLMLPEYADVLQELYTKAEKTKIQLSKTMSAQITVRAGAKSAIYTITREDMGEIVADLYRKTESVMRLALKDAKLRKEDIDNVVLVGGSSKIPYIYEHVKEYFGKEPSRDVNPNEVVALGAALYAKQVVAKSGRKIVDVCSHGIGIRALNKKGQEYNDIIIKANTKLPANCEKKYRIGEDKVSAIYVSVLEGDFEEITDVTEICGVDLDLPCVLSQGDEVFVRIAVDEYQLLHIFIRVPKNGNMETEVLFDRNSNISRAEVTKWKQSVQKAVESIEPKARSGILSGLFGRKKDQAGADGNQASGEGAGPTPSGTATPDTTSGAGAAGVTTGATPDKSATPGMAPKAEKKPEVKKEDPLKDVPKVVKNVMAEIIGMDEIREAMRDYDNRMKLTKKRSLSFMRVEDEDHCIALFGKSGFGLTTAAQMIATCLRKMGYSSDKEPVITNMKEIIKADEQQTTTAIQDLFQQAMNGVLIVDDFHTFYDDSDTFAGMMAIDMLLAAYMASQKKVILIIAGHADEMSKIFDKKERFARIFMSHTIHMVGYSAEEYVQIMHQIAKNQGYVLDSAADSKLERHISGESKMPDFDNIHYIEELLDKAKTDVANKASKKRHATDEDLSIIRADNFQLAASNKSLEELLEELNSLTGLAAVKSQVQALVDEIKVQKRAEAEGRVMPEVKTTMHMLFMGHAGTGKTTVARLIGEIYRELGILTRGHFVEVTRKDIVSDIVGGTAKNVDALVKQAMGGILFIDEAYSVCKDDFDTFGQEAVDTLVPLVENHRKEFICIMAGYEDDMRKFLDKNEGLKSRFPIQIDFEDYTVDEMVEIFQVIVRSNKMEMEGRALPTLRDELAKRSKAPGFANGRGVRNLFDDVVRRQKARIRQLTDWGENEQLIIRTEDIGDGVDESAKEAQLQQALRELDDLVGLTEMKQEIHDLVEMARFNILREKKGMKVVEESNHHMIFLGNAGTGKTTVARLIAKIYNAIGVIPTDKLVEAGRSNLVAGYQGQSAIKTTDVVNSALGGVLFIDEAYQLVNGDQDSFGMETLDTLVALTENYRKDFVCIMAGYESDMQRLFTYNQGLTSRFPHNIHFTDYTVDDKLEMFRRMAAHGEYLLGEGCEERLRSLMEMRGNKDLYANGRGVRNIYETTIRSMSRRVMNWSLSRDLSEEDMVTIIPEDIS